MTAPYTSDLDHALADAVHHGEKAYADEVGFKVLRRSADGAPVLFRVTVHNRYGTWLAQHRDKLQALSLAMAGLRAATGGAA